MESPSPTVATPPDTAAGRAAFVRAALPEGGLFAGHEWRIAPDPFPLPAGLVSELESLGRVLLQFYRAANLLYRQSAEGRQPGWVARWLDLGKPSAAIDRQRHPAFKNELPRVIRPDLLLTADGLALTELDSVPGGIGLTAWLNQTYARSGAPVIGGAAGMIEGFAGIFGAAPRVHLVVSEESATYRPEMRWLAGELNAAARGQSFTVEEGQPFAVADGEAVYRFFELFDADQVPCAAEVFAAAEAKRIRLTPPPKAFLEEKMFLALLWNGNLREYWRRELGAAFLDRMLRITPMSWVVDPAPLPPHAAIPDLGLTEWAQLKALSQRERELILKVSGFSALAWGARGVHLGSDLSAADWSAAVDEALAGFDRSPSILQRYHKPAVVRTEWFDSASRRLEPMDARVRLCPYYFVNGEGDSARAKLGGVLATLCPADKKIIHGMRDAILAPCAPAP